MHVSEVRADLLAEQQVLDEIVAGLSDDQWALPTPSPRWAIADQIGHLTYFDHTAGIAITDPDAFAPMVGELFEVAMTGEEAVDDLVLGPYRAMSPTELLAAWRADRAVLAEASATLADDARIAWYGPSMGSKSFLTARLMEVWAHGQDIVDTVGAERSATDRLRHIAQLGVITRKWSYQNRGEEAPDADIRVELTSPSGETWRFGPDEAPESVSGAAEDFCLVVTQRRHADDTGLVVDGSAARDWLIRAQAFAGPATDGPGAGVRT